ncbi:MAG TPA: hypothetical protein VN253_15635, partial [Kofleriaceae bacterium]|nr:hypothetical protein [Kofleriaceae bacterium]
VAGDVVRVFRQGHLEASFTNYPGPIKLVGVDGDDVYAVTDEPAVIVVDAIDAPARRRIFHAGTKPISDVRFDRDRGQILAASWDQFLYVWDAATGSLVRKLEGAGPLHAIRMSPDGALAIGVGGISPTIWDRTTGAQLGQLEGHSDAVRNGEFLDDRIFISIAANHIALVWDVQAARALTTFHDVGSLVSSPDRRWVALIGPTGVRVWSPRFPVPDLDGLPVISPQ